MRLEFFDTNIKFSLIQPGPIDSDFRRNSFSYYEKHIDPTNSVFESVYQGVEARLTRKTLAKFTLPPESVLAVTVHALQSPSPKIRYAVTIPTKVIKPLKRILSDKMLDKFLSNKG